MYELRRSIGVVVHERVVRVVYRALQELASSPDSAADTKTTIRAIKYLTSVTQAPASLAKMLPSAQAALAAAAPSLRILGCHIIAQWLRCTGEEADSKQPVSLLLYMLEVQLREAQPANRYIQSAAMPHCLWLSYAILLHNFQFAWLSTPNFYLHENVHVLGYLTCHTR